MSRRKTYKYYGQFRDPQLDEYLHKKFFSRRKKGFFIEAGAHNGIDDSNCKFFEENGWSGINIEPDPVIFNDLTNNRPESTNLNVGLGRPRDAGRRLPFTTVLDGEFHTGLGSFHLTDEDRERYENEGRTLETIDVQIVSYANVIESYDVEKVDLFSLDVEGGEIDVITGMYGSSVLPKIMCVEYPRVTLKRLREALDILDYKYHSTVHNCAFFKRK